MTTADTTRSSDITQHSSSESTLDYKTIDQLQDQTYKTKHSSNTNSSKNIELMSEAKFELNRYSQELSVIESIALVAVSTTSIKPIVRITVVLYEVFYS